MAYVNAHKQQWKKRDGPSCVPASVVERPPETIGHQIGRNHRHWTEKDGPSCVPASVAWRSHETSAHQIWRNQHWKERDGPSCVPSSVVWRVKEGPSSRLPEINAHQMGRNQHWRERDGPSHVPESVAWQFRQDLNPRLPKNNGHQIGRNQHWQERDDLSHGPASLEWRFRKGLNLRSPETSAHEIGRDRHWKERDGPSRVPALFRKDLNLKPPKPVSHQSGRIEYAGTAISRWPVSVEAIECQPGEKPLALARSCIVNEEDEMGRDHRKKPWVHIAETVMQDLVCSFNALKCQIKDQSMDGIKPTVVARFGKIIFRGSPSFPVETCGDKVTKASLKWLTRIFYTNLPSLYMENVTHKIIPEVGLSFKSEKDIYLVKLCDLSRPRETICCKVELGQRRHVVVDVSCLNKDLDMRLMLRAE
ncbi:hypothetical protein BT93_B1705 [Corymbia citriodora subsp. variegata]|nr:hypothetical protein BT93_B1705 [Corymbia citriodora subsp. variegata]